MPDLLLHIIRVWLSLATTVAGLWAIVVDSVKASAARKAVGR